MKNFGIFLLVVGMLALLIAFNMDVSVATSYGGRVNNFGLMAQRQNYILLSCLIIVCSILMIAFGGRKQQPQNHISVENVLYVKCPYCAEDIHPEAIKCKHCGSDLPTKDKSKKIITTISPSELVIKLKDNYMINEDGVKKLVSFLSEKYGNDKELFVLAKNDINKMMNSIPTEVHESFKRKVKHFIYELDK